MNFLGVMVGKLVHESVLKCGLDQDVFVGTSLIYMYGKCEPKLKSVEITEQRES
ncbi:hypothetical protein MTR_3g021180 [Medicago truncatula]|uniref:Uncharacterized protein n=1 Tax=Medicago truncatula TaxID=3880 RepID=G7IZ29_MEDTR|nr:hypothetical protein MTR_3g021180 [Medicago truncatula]